MYKKIILVTLTVLMLFSLSGCKSDDYNEAIQKVEYQDYEEAIEIFVSLGDYKDSEEQLVSTIYEYGESLTRFKNYEDAISLYSKYSSYGECKNRLLETIDAYADYLVDKCDYSNAILLYEQCSSAGDFSDKIASLQAEKETYDIYYDAMKLLEKGSYEQGFEKLDALPSEYRNIKGIKQSYADLKDSPFKGYHSNRQGSNSQSIKFNFKFNIENECFNIHAYKAVYWSDGTVYKDYNFYLTTDDISGDTVKAGKFTWTVNADGSITEVEKGQTAKYN